MSTALNRTGIALLTNKSGGALAYGAVVVVDSANAEAVTTTTTSGYVNGQVGVVIEPNGIANDGLGAIAFGIFLPRVNLSSAASLGDLFKTHTVAGQAVRHAPPVVAGDFGMVLETGTTPAALLFGSPVQNVAGGSVADHLADASDAHDASAISIVDTGAYFTGTDVEAALQELGAGGGGHTIQDEGTPLTARANLNFVGAGVAVTDDAGNNATKVTISGGGAGAFDDTLAMAYAIGLGG